MNEQVHVNPVEVMSEKRRYSVPGLAAYYVSLAIDIVLLYLFNNIKYLNLSVLNKDQFTSCLWAINLALTFGIIGNFILLLYRPRWFYHLVQVILNITVVLAFYILYTLFPFVFDREIFRTIVKIALIAVMAGTTIAVIIELVRFIIAMLHRDSPIKQTGGSGLAAVPAEALESNGKMVSTGLSETSSQSVDPGISSTPEAPSSTVSSAGTTNTETPVPPDPPVTPEQK